MNVDNTELLFMYYLHSAPANSFFLFSNVLILKLFIENG